MAQTTQGTSLELARDMALTEMRNHGITGWSFKFDNAKRRCGSTQYGKKTITLSRPYVLLNSEKEVLETILHEIAHVIAGPEAGHGPQWRKAARSVGAKPVRCAGPEVNLPKPKWRLVCANSHVIGHRHRRSKSMTDSYRCRCGGALKYILNE